MSNVKQILLALGLAGLALCPGAVVSGGAGDAGVLVDGVAAHVNTHVITIGEVRELAGPVVRQLQARYSGKDLEAKVREAGERARESLIERYLILDVYEQRDMQMPDWVVDQHIEGIIQDTFDGDRAELMAALTADRMTYDEWREEIESLMIVTAMRQENVDRHVEVSPVAVREAYEQNRESRRRPAEVKCRMIVLSGSGETADARRRQAEEIRTQALSGKDFGELAQEVSDGIYAERGGDWGWVKPGDLRPELAAVLQGLPAGRVSDVVETGDELYLLKVEDRREAREASFEDVRADLELELEQEQRERLYKNWIGRLRQKAYVNVFPVDVF